MDLPNNNAALFSPSKIPFLILVWLLFGVTETMGIPNAEISDSAQSSCKTGPSNNYTQILWNTHRCCNSCPPGTYMVQLCLDNDPSSTLCKECDPGTYTEYRNLVDSCLPQRHCRRYEITVSVGSTTSKAKCVCKPGYTRSPEGGCRRVPNWKPATISVLQTPTYAKTERPASLPHKENKTEPGPTTAGNKQQPDIETKPQGNKIRDSDGGEEDPDKGKYQVIGDDVKSGSTLDGIYIVIIIVSCIVAIVAIVAIVRRKRSHHTEYHSQHDHYEMASTNTSGHRNSTPPTDDLIDLEGDSQTNLLYSGSTTAVATEETSGPTSPNSSQNLEDSEALGLRDTQKPKSTTSINNLVKAVHGTGCLEPSTETSQ